VPILDKEEGLPLNLRKESQYREVTMPKEDKNLLTGEIDRPSTERVEPVRGCLITQAVWNEPP
jgi:hypothetical protein